MCEAMEVYGNNKLNEGRSKGRTEGKKEMAIQLYKEGVSIATIAAAADVSTETVRQWIGVQPS